MSVKKTSLFTMCHYSEFHKITYVNFWRNDLQDDVQFSLGKCFLATQKTLQSSTRKTQNHAICWLRDQRVKEHSCIWNYSKSYRRTFSETNNKFIPSFVKLIFPIIIWSLFLQRYCAIVLSSMIMHLCQQRYSIKKLCCSLAYES